MTIVYFGPLGIGVKGLPGRGFRTIHTICLLNERHMQSPSAIVILVLRVQAFWFRIYVFFLGSVKGSGSPPSRNQQEGCQKYWNLPSS